MDSALKALRLELVRATDEIVKRNLRYAIHFATKAIAQQKTLAKKAEKKIKRDTKDREDAVKEALRDIEKRRKR